MAEGVYLVPNRGAMSNAGSRQRGRFELCIDSPYITFLAGGDEYQLWSVRRRIPFPVFKIVKHQLAVLTKGCQKTEALGSPLEFLYLRVAG
jgi:hypothetical protein